MMDFKNLWIGDEVYVYSLKSNAQWEGIDKNGKALIKHKGEIIRVELDDLTDKSTEVQVDKKLFELKEELAEAHKTKPRKYVEASLTTLDLHIEKLAPHLTNQPPQMILNHQLTQAKVFIDDAISARKMMINIVHGKGTGALKTEIKNMLENFPEVKSTYDKNEGGATEVWFNY